MRCSTRFVLAIPLAALIVACSDAPGPAGPDVAVDAVALTPALSRGVPGGQVVMLDACDPVTFNAAFEAEVCTPTTPRSGMRFSTFVALLERHQRVDAWRFAPDVIRSPRTRTLRVPNKGGIPHSFTEVEEFGGGFIPLLNELSGNLEPAPECVHPENPAAPHPDVRLIPPGAEDLVTFEPGKEKKYMCCIHPWMRAVSR